MKKKETIIVSMNQFHLQNEALSFSFFQMVNLISTLVRMIVKATIFIKLPEKEERVYKKEDLLNYGTRIEHDSFGRVRRIGNTFINYDNRDRVNRIGTVYMRYNRTALTQIGGMRIVYNRRGEIVDTVGNIKGYITDMHTTITIIIMIIIIIQHQTIII